MFIATFENNPVIKILVLKIKRLRNGREYDLTMSLHLQFAFVGLSFGTESASHVRLVSTRTGRAMRRAWPAPTVVHPIRQLSSKEQFPKIHVVSGHCD